MFICGRGSKGWGWSLPWWAVAALRLPDISAVSESNAAKLVGPLMFPVAARMHAWGGVCVQEA